MKGLIGGVLLLAVLCGCGATAYQKQYDQGLQHLNKGSYAAAVEAFAAAIESDPERAEAYIGRGDAYARTEGGAALAEADYQTALALDPARSELYEKLAEGYLADGRLEAAAVLLATGVEQTGSEVMREKLDEINALSRLAAEVQGAAICHMYRGTKDRALYTTDLNGDGEGDWVVAAQNGAQGNLLCAVRKNGVWSADYFYNMAASGLSWMTYSERMQCPLLWISYASFSGGSTQIMPYRGGPAECCARQQDEPLWESDPEGDPLYQSTYWVEGSEVTQAEHQSYVDALGSVELAKASAVKALGEEWITGRRLGLNRRWLDTLAAMVAEAPFVTDRAAADINGDDVTDHCLTVTADRRVGPTGMQVSRYEGVPTTPEEAPYQGGDLWQNGYILLLSDGDDIRVELTDHVKAVGSFTAPEGSAASYCSGPIRDVIDDFGTSYEIFFYEGLPVLRYTDGSTPLLFQYAYRDYENAQNIYGDEPVCYVYANGDMIMAEGLTAAMTLGELEEQAGELTLEEVGGMEGDWVSPAWRAYFIRDGIRFYYEWSSDAARQSDPADSAVAIWEEYLDGIVSQ